MSSTRHGFKRSIVYEYTCILRSSFFMWCFLCIFIVLLCTIWTFPIGTWFGPWICEQVDRVTDIRFGFRYLRPEAVNSKV